MLLSHKTMVQMDQNDANIVGHMCYAAYKLWNICNYERMHYAELGLKKYPDWYYQKAAHKDDLWARNLPSQTAQEVSKLLDKAWRSYYRLREKGTAEHPNPPYFKHAPIAITYMQKGIVHEKGSDTVRLSISKQLRTYMASEYDIHEKYLYLKNRIFQDMDHIKQIRIYPPEQDGTCRVIVIYEADDVEMKEDNGHYLSIDLGLHNLMTCYDNSGKCFIAGRKYLSICRRYDKEIARVQSQWAKAQADKGVKYPKPSKHLLKLYEKKKNSIHDYLHKLTRYIVDYCEENDIRTAVIGDWKGIRKGFDKGAVTNQKMHGLPYEKLYTMLDYKLALKGIRMIKQEESYTSQCSPESDEVSREYGIKANRVHRGLYVEKTGKVYNADAVGAYNILRKNTAVTGREIDMPVSGLERTTLTKVAV